MQVIKVRHYTDEEYDLLLQGIGQTSKTSRIEQAEFMSRLYDVLENEK